MLEARVVADGAAPPPAGARGGDEASGDAGAGPADVDDAAPDRARDVPAVRAAVARALVALGGTAVEEREGWLRTCLAPPPEGVDRFLARARTALAESVGPEGAPTVAGAIDVRWRWERDRDWVGEWRRGLSPRRVGDRLVVVPPDVEFGARGDDLVLRVEPGMAFGTGAHATTRGALRLLESAVRPADRVLDVGTGSGILAVAAVRLGARRVLAVDREEMSVRAARDTLDRNGVADHVTLLHAELDAPLVRLLAPTRFDVVVGNVVAPFLSSLLGPFRRITADDGRLIVGGIVDEEADGFTREAETAGWTVVRVDREEGWWSGTFRPDPEGDA